MRRYDGGTQMHELLANLDTSYPADQLVLTTVRLLVTRADGSRTQGTAFWFVPYLDADLTNVRLALVTNKHVLAQATEIRMTLRKAAKDGTGVKPTLETFEVRLSNPLDYIIFHPTLDIAAIPPAPIMHASQELSCYPYVSPVHASWMLSDEQLSTDLYAIESVVLVGYPIGLSDIANNLPLVRTGTTATPAYLDFSDQGDALVDIAVFPGSSGSPVFAFSGPTYRVKNRQPGHADTQVGWRRVFLGMLWGGPVVDDCGRISAAEIPSELSRATAVTSRVHLGYYVRAKHLLFINDELTK